MDLNYIPLVTAFIGTIIAAIWDFKTTEVPDQLPFAMIAIALLFYGYQSFATSSYTPILNSLTYGLGFLLFGGFMYYTGQWGGADSLILSALGFLLPVTPQGFTQTIIPFPLSYVINLFIVGAVYMLGYGFWFAIKNTTVMNNFVTEMKASINVLVIGAVGLFVLFYVVSLNIGKILYNSIDLAQAFHFTIYPVLGIGLLYVIWKFANSVQNYGFRKKIPISKLKVGDMLFSEKKLIGITKEEMKALKRSSKQYVEIKLGAPFAVAFPLTLLVTLFVGDLILVLVNLL